MTNACIDALDFDGVICDSAVETAMTGWQAATALWQDMPKTVPPQMIEGFRSVRPIIETGYEAILTMRLLYLGETSAAIFNRFREKNRHLMAEVNVSVEDLKKLFGETRDRWIAQDPASWIDNNPLFPGVADKLQRLSQWGPWYVVTTKQERFVKQILQANAIELADDRIFGLDRNMSKADVLLELLRIHPDKKIRFVEDRLPTLQNILKHPELATVDLSFARWGYNTAEDKALAEQQSITSLNLEDFLQNPA